MQYQLVLQFSGKLIDINEIEQMESDLIELLKDAEVDGHDVGSGEVNFFIFTDHPENSFKNLKQYLVDKELLNAVKVAYRHAEKEQYIPLYPSSLKNFEIQ